MAYGCALWLLCFFITRPFTFILEMVEMTLKTVKLSRRNFVEYK